MKKIAIIGSGGTGKSTLAKELGQILNLPVYHLDSFFWKSGWIQIDESDFDHILKSLIVEDKWIIDGNYQRTMDMRFQEADTIIYLDYPTYISLFRVIKRRIQYHGKTRPDMGAGCKEKIDLEFIKWILNYRKNKRPKYLEKLSKLKDSKTVQIFKSPRELKDYLTQLKKESITNI